MLIQGRSGLLATGLIASALTLGGCKTPEETPVSPEAVAAASGFPFLPADEVHDLSRPTNPPRFARIARPPRLALGEGWSDPEPWGVWAVGERSTFHQWLPDRGAVLTDTTGWRGSPKSQSLNNLGQESRL